MLLRLLLGISEASEAFAEDWHYAGLAFSNQSLGPPWSKHMHASAIRKGRD